MEQSCDMRVFLESGAHYLRLNLDLTGLCKANRPYICQLGLVKLSMYNELRSGFMYMKEGRSKSNVYCYI